MLRLSENRLEHNFETEPRHDEENLDKRQA